MFDPDFAASFDFADGLPDASLSDIVTVDVDGIRSVARDADRNFRRVLSLMSLPVHMFRLGLDWSESVQKAAGEMIRDGVPMADDDATGEAISDRATALMNEIYRADGSEDDAESEGEQDEEGDDEPEIGWDSFEQSLLNVSQMIAAFHNDAIEAATYALFSAVVTQSWTTFEALAADLWIATLNCRPRLGLVAINADVTDQDNEEEADKKGRIPFSVPSRLLFDPKFVLQERMGTLMRSKWEFSKREEAAEAYYKVFGKDTPQLRAIFKDEPLRWLAEVRNVLVHRAGVADEKFSGRVARHPRLSQVEKGKVIPLDGPLVAEMVNVSMLRCFALLRFVDGWLAANPR